MEQNNVIEVKTFEEIGKTITDFAQQVIDGNCSNKNGIAIIKYGPEYPRHCATYSNWNVSRKGVVFHKVYIMELKLFGMFNIDRILREMTDCYHDSLIKITVNIFQISRGVYDIHITEKHAV